MRIAIVFEPDPDLGPDPLDEHKETRSQGLFLDSAKTDVIVIYRQIGEQYEGGHRDHLISSGIWESVTIDQFVEVLATLGSLPEP